MPKSPSVLREYRPQHESSCPFSEGSSFCQVISKISVHREVTNCGLRKGQRLPIGIVVLIVLDCGCVDVFNFLIF